MSWHGRSAGKIQSNIIRSQLHEEIERLCENPVGISMGTIHFVQHHDGRRPMFKDFDKAPRICDKGPSWISTTSNTTSAIPGTYSIFPAKSACSGMSIMLILVRIKIKARTIWQKSCFLFPFLSRGNP